MDNETGLPLLSDNAYDPPLHPGYPLATGEKEGAYMHYRNGYYYLFWNTGSCCSGTSSDYLIWVSRSKNITGPFTGDKKFYESVGNIRGPGHMGIYSNCGVERFTYHYYPTARSILGINEFTWSDDDWPVLGPQMTKPLEPCGVTDVTATRSIGKGSDVTNQLLKGINTVVNGTYTFPHELQETEKKVSVYTYSGRLIKKATTQKNRIDLKRDFGIQEGLYIIWATTL